MSTPESQPPGQPTPDPAPNPTPADGGESRQWLFLEPLTALPNETAEEFAERALDQIKRNLWLRLRAEGRIPRSPPPEEGPPEGR